MKCPDTGLPSHDDDTSVLGILNDLPEDDKFGDVKLCDFTKTAVLDETGIFISSEFTSLNSLYDFEKMATVLGNPKFSHDAARWTTDVEFGRQILNGMNPVVIKRCTELPTNFPVTNEMVIGSLNRGKTLHEEMKVAFISLTLHT